MELKYKGKSYQVEEPTIDMWSKIIALQEWTDEREFSIKLMSMITGLTEQEIENADAIDVVKATTELSTFLMEKSNEFKNEIEFKGKHYKFIDLPNLTFGEFIDIDTFLTKTPAEKKKEMHLLMAMLYREVDDKGNYLPYDSKKIQLKAEEFRQLPVRYLNGATSFFLRLDRILRGGLRGSSWLQMKLVMKMIWLSVKLSVLIGFGVGLGRLYLLLAKTSQRLKKLLNIR
jgi:hypothetical protein